MFDLDYWQAQAQSVFDIVLNWLQSPTFWAQIGGIVAAWFIAKIVARIVKNRTPLLNTEPKEGRFLTIRELIYSARELVSPLMLVAVLAGVIPALDAVTGSSWLVKIAQSLSLVLALKTAIELFVPSAGLQKIIKLVVLPSALMLVFGVFDQFTTVLERDIALQLGNIRISALFLVKAAIFGALIFWVAGLSNKAGQNAIESQEALDLGTKSLVSKLFQIILFVVMGIVFFQLMAIDLTALAVLGGAVGVGLGFGLQQIAANFISGMIILLERSLSIGDYIEMENGKAGILKEINMRSSTLETFDGKEIMLPNEKFITTTFTNWTRDDPRQRYEVEFQVSYDTDVEMVAQLISKEVSNHPQILNEPERVDTELRGFGDSGINMAVEFWADGIDDGKNRFSADVLLIIWRTLREAGVSIPFPQREVRVLSDEPKLKIKKKVITES